MVSRMKPHSLTFRDVDDHGEILVVRNVLGINSLVDPCDENIVVVVPCGRRAVLVDFTFDGFAGRDAHVTVIHEEAGLGFARVGQPKVRVPISELLPGQKVHVLPASDPASAHAVVIRPLPVLFGAATVQPHVYAHAA